MEWCTDPVIKNWHRVTCTDDSKILLPFGDIVSFASFPSVNLWLPEGTAIDQPSLSRSWPSRSDDRPVSGPTWRPPPKPYCRRAYNMPLFIVGHGSGRSRCRDPAFFSFSESDSFAGDTSQPFEIYATVRDLPASLMRQDRFGFELRGWPAEN